MSDADLDELEQVACPSAGACGAQFTANTMATVSEAIGLALPYSAGAPAPYEIRDRFCRRQARMVMDLVSRTSVRATSSPAGARERRDRRRRLGRARPTPPCTCRRSP
jgi:dihydroxyacid dehydratase/phosphogluconate dehydratase